MTREWPTLEQCIAIATSSLSWTKSMIQENIKDGDPAEKIIPKINQKEFRDFLMTYGLPENQINLMLSSSRARREFLANNDLLKMREIAQLINEGKDIKEKMLEASQFGSLSPVNRVLQVQHAAVLAYELSEWKIPQYTLVNQIYSVNVNWRTPVMYGGEKMTYWEAQKRQISTIVEDNVELLKRACEDTMGKKR